MLAKVKLDDFTIEKLNQDTYCVLKGDTHLITLSKCEGGKIEISVFITGEVFRVLVATW